jgi:hypothetical protein
MTHGCKSVAGTYKRYVGLTPASKSAIVGSSPLLNYTAHDRLFSFYEKKNVSIENHNNCGRAYIIAIIIIYLKYRIYRQEMQRC